VAHRLDDLADQLLAVAAAVAQRRVEEIDAQVQRSLEGGDGFVVILAAPPAADSPPAETDLADLESRPSQRAILHLFSFASAQHAHHRLYTAATRQCKPAHRL